WRGHEAFRAWLFVLATRKLTDRRRFHTQQRRDLRKEEMPAEEEELLLQGYASLATPSRNAAAREELQRVEGAIQLLPEAQREAILLSRVAGLSYAEIARHKGCHESAVRGLVARGLARLTLHLGGS
ncbi:MAG: RNA polymerase sigma factor, partial [Deltaproteobacteria bacterium]|nr:RNA polymerase sigma factor [Deltaproteobacteria bacterium]